MGYSNGLLESEVKAKVEVEKEVNKVSLVLVLN